MIAQRSLTDRDPLVRAAACNYFAEGDVGERLQLLTPMLSDRVRLVRTAAATSLASVPQQTLMSTALNSLEIALADYKKALRVDSDLASSHVALALLASNPTHNFFDY